MSNTLTSLIPTLIGSITQISREGIGFIEAVDQDFNDMQAAVGQTITLGSADAATVGNVSAATTGPTPTDSVNDSVSHSISKSRSAVFALTGEEQRGMANRGPEYRSAKIEEAFRALTNEIEVDIGVAAAKGGFAFGTAGTTPFATTTIDAFTAEKLLYDAGAIGDMHLVLDSAAWLKLGSLTALTNANLAGSDSMLRFAKFPSLANLNLHRSGQVGAPTVGTGTSYQTDTPAAATLAVGTTSIPLDTGSGTVLAGDIVTFTGDTNKYVVRTGIAAAGTIVLGGTGLKATLANNVAMAIVAAARRNIAMTRRAVILSTRLPAMPEGGDSADDVATVTDPFSGLSFQVALYRQRRQVAIEVAIAWGASVRKFNEIVQPIG